MQRYTDESGAAFVLLRAGIEVQGMPDLRLVEFAPANDHQQKTLMPEQEWDKQMHKPLHDLDCHHCKGTAKDPSRTNTPCGYCFGTGWLDASGEPLTKDPATADALVKIRQMIVSLSAEANRLNHPRVQALFKEMETEAIAEAERQWRNGNGAGPSGQRHTGD